MKMAKSNEEVVKRSSEENKPNSRKPQTRSSKTLDTELPLEANDKEVSLIINVRILIVS